MLAVASNDIPDALQALEDRWAGELSPEAYAASQRAIDLDAESTVCPACSTPFKPGRPRCPGCGLRVG
ncbi:MAG: hypothetical protein L6Q99_05465 [Planctomycetes bacterium]|nr:hypothetical protein [Planctomycetota bacterium]